MIVSDSSPLIYLTKANSLALLKDIHGEILVSEGVLEEVLVKGKPGTTRIEKALDEGWLGKVDSQVDFDPESEGISEVDAEIVCLARDRDLELLTNDKALSYSAKSHGVKSKWFSLIVVGATEGGLLSPDDAEKLLTELIRAGLRIRSEVFAELVKRIRGLRTRTIAR